jgi:excinuclease ABC subunit A
MGDTIRLRGVRQNNLKNFDLDIPINQLTVITGVSGSGKSSLAFDTLFAEGQRRYIETFSPYARQFFDRMDKPQVDRIEGIPPAIAIEQKNTVKSTRSTVGTMTEICDFMKDLWLHFSQAYCDGCGVQVASDYPEVVWRNIQEKADDYDYVLIVFSVPLSVSLGVEECLKGIISQGFQRCLIAGKVTKIDDLFDGGIDSEMPFLDVVQDRVRPGPRSRSRVVEACENAFSFGKERLQVFGQSGEQRIKSLGHFSRLLECASCQRSIATPSRSLFSFNSPVGACPMCRGFGRVIGVDYQLTIPDESLSLAGGAVKLWQSGHGLRSQRDMMKLAKKEGVPTNLPVQDMTSEQKTWVIYGSPGYGEGSGHRWPKAWYGIKGYFDWLESKAYKMHYRVLLSRYRSYYECSKCHGTRFKPEVLSFRVDPDLSKSGSTIGKANDGIDLPTFYRLPVEDALGIVSRWGNGLKVPRSSPLIYALEEVSSRLQFLVDVGLGYLTLDRPTKTLSGGETERINLTSCLGTRLVNTLFVLDEPSVGLHAMDIQNLVTILRKLKDAGNTVVVVEHDAEIIRAADYVIDIGPKSGAEGGELIFAGKAKKLATCRTSITARYLNGKETISVEGFDPDAEVSSGGDWLAISNATRHNLKSVSARIPLNRFVCLTGVSGSGKTTLAKEILVPELERLLAFDANSGTESGRKSGSSPETPCSGGAILSGFESLDAVVMVDQSPIGKTPRSNPVVYIGVFEYIRKLFASSGEAQSAGLTAGAFSFNSPAGRCERCRGAGYEKIEMQFLSDVFIGCPDCGGNRYKRAVRGFKIDFAQFEVKEGAMRAAKLWSVVDVLESTVDEVLAILKPCQCAAARRAATGLEWLQAVGLGYLKLGQPINTLSGGESQRLKVVKRLCHTPWGTRDEGNTLFIFDEPTTGLHFSDVNVLLRMFRQMTRSGHSLLVIEHHLDLIRNADWLMDLGPGAGERGGKMIFEGKPLELCKLNESATGKHLAQFL